MPACKFTKKTLLHILFHVFSSHFLRMHHDYSFPWVCEYNFFQRKVVLLVIGIPEKWDPGPIHEIWDPRRGTWDPSPRTWDSAGTHTWDPELGTHRRDPGPGTLHLGPFLKHHTLILATCHMKDYMERNNFDLCYVMFSLFWFGMK